MASPAGLSCDSRKPKSVVGAELGHRHEVPLMRPWTGIRQGNGPAKGPAPIVRWPWGITLFGWSGDPGRRLINESRLAETLRELPRSLAPIFRSRGRARTRA